MKTRIECYILSHLSLIKSNHTFIEESAFTSLNWILLLICINKKINSMMIQTLTAVTFNLSFDFNGKNVITKSQR